jgi:hypothetical protein
MKEIQLSDNLQVIINHFKYNHQEFAEIFEINPKSVTNYKNSQLPKIEFMIKLNDLTGLSIDKLLYSQVRSIDLPDRPYGRLPVLDESGMVLEKPLFDDFEIRKLLRELSDRINVLERKEQLREGNNINN